MERLLKLVGENGKHGSYRRGDHKTDTIYTFYQYKEIQAVYSRSAGTLNCKDGLAEKLLQDNLISVDEKSAYEEQLYQYFAPIDAHDDLYIEQIYDEICLLRRNCFGVEALEKEYNLQVDRRCSFDPSGGIDQRKKKEALIRNSTALLFILCQPELTWLMEEDVERAKAQGKHVCCLNNKSRNLDLETIPWDEQFGEAVRGKTAGILVYGEEGLLHCRGLKVDAVVHAVPSWYHTRALTNQFGFDRACVIYVPAGLDMIQWVPCTERSRLTYLHLAKLWESYGDEIYSCSPGELYQRYPQYFLNIYDNQMDCPEAEPEYPIRVQWSEGQEALEFGDFVDPSLQVMRVFDQLRDRQISTYLNGIEGLTYQSAYFDEQMNLGKVDWIGNDQKNGIMVQAVKIKQVEESQVINCEGYSILREMLADFRKKDKNGIQLLSNFLFFLTPKLAHLYNDLRTDRPKEQIAFDKMHLDYMLYTEGDERIETFPLFRKACIAMKENGQFMFFHFHLGGGRIVVGKSGFRWGKEDVNTFDERPVKIYTPYTSVAEQDSDPKTYRKPVGEGRINLVIVQDRIICVRDGDVILPSIGVVVSLEREIGKAFLHENGLLLSENGYVDCAELKLQIRLDAPAEVREDEWRQVRWAYGGGLSLVIDGTGICDRDLNAQEDSSNQMIAYLAEEGWMSPLSCQTQESALHKMAKHPRTAIGVTNENELVILVYSGRTRMSTGADYSEMIMITRKLFPDIKHLMNVDGGGSAMLGMAIDGRFMELSYPATSMDSCAGMVRPINTVLCLELMQ